MDYEHKISTLALLLYSHFKDQQQNKSNLYEHIRDSSTRHDAQTLDAATESQQQTLQRPIRDQETADDNDINTHDDFLAEEDVKEDNIKACVELTYLLIYWNGPVVLYLSYSAVFYLSLLSPGSVIF